MKVTNISFLMLFLLLLFPFLVYSQDSLTIKGFERGNNSKTELGKKKAIIIGISKYQNIKSLNYADKDAKAFYQFLLSNAGGIKDTQNIKILLNEEATAANIWKELSWLLGNAKEGEEVIIYFSGHGDVERELCPQLGFLLGYDSPKELYPAGGTIPVDFLQSYAENLTKKGINVLFIIDACKSGKLVGGEEGKEATANALKQQWGNINKILSCQPSEYSLEDKKWCGGGGVFTCNLIDGLNGLADENQDGKISILEIYSYVTKAVNMETGNMQTPVLSSSQLQNIVTSVDDETLIKLKNKKNNIAGNENSIVKKGIEDNFDDIKDKKILKKIKEFYNFLKEDKLLQPEEKNAYTVYNELLNEESLKNQIDELKYSLIASLQNKSQIIFNNYLSSIEIPDSISFLYAAKQLELAANLLGSDNSLYKYIKARELFLKGVSFKKSDRIQSSELFFKSLELEPEAAYVYNELGMHYIDEKDFYNAEKCFLKAIEISPKWLYPVINLGVLYSHSNIENSNNIAITYINKALDINPNFAPAYYNIGLLYYDQENIDDAIDYFSKAISINNKYCDAYFFRGELQFFLNKKKEALDDFSAIINIDSLYKNKREAKYFSLIEHNKSSENYNNIDYNIGSALVYNYRAIIWFELSKYHNCILDLSQSIKYDSSNSINYYNRGLAYANINNYENAILDFNKSILLDSNLLEANFNIAISYYNQDKYEYAIKYFKKSIENNFNIRTAHNFLGLSYYYLKLYNNAIIELTEAIKLNEENPQLYYNRGIVYFDMKDYKKAYDDLSEAIALNSGIAVYFYNRGIICEYLLKYEDAINDYEKAIELNHERVHDLRYSIEKIKLKMKEKLDVEKPDVEK